MFIRYCVLVSALAALATLAVARQSSSSCPDKKASQVPAEIKLSEATHTCGIGFVVFGVGGGIFGEECPETKITTPAHQTCQGEENAGTACVPEGDMAVTVRDCSCGGLVIPVIQVGIPTTCECDPPVNAGTVEDFKTVVCVSTHGYSTR
ncbi:MAG: hypothetical protein IT453_15450 [Planctomycetes bacterium]|nr:hypothetical protein [Planctomycetota bacterium]